MNAPALIPQSEARLPQAYEAAKSALANCESVDECKDWADKAAALASYAKQADDEDLMKRAMRIRARAIRRCGELLKQFDASGRKGKAVDLPTISQREAAVEAGLSQHQTKQAVRVANVPSETFDSEVESHAPPSVTKLADMGRKPRKVIDHGDRDPTDFNKAMHFKGMLRDYSRELAGWNIHDLLPRLIDSDRAEVRKIIGQIDAVHDTIMTRI